MARQPDSAGGFGHSLTDLMTSIAVIFILLFLVFLKNEQDALASRLRQTDSTVEVLLAKLAGELSANAATNEIEVKIDPDDPLTVLIILRDRPDILSFLHDDHKVQPAGKAFLRNFVPTVSEIICSPEMEQLVDSLIIEGHTNSSGPDDHNTLLSVKRATAVLVESRKILARNPGIQELHRGNLESCFLRISQATGRGEQEIVPGASGAENFRASRRVVLKVRVRSLEQRAALGAAEE